LVPSARQVNAVLIKADDVALEFHLEHFQAAILKVTAAGVARIGPEWQ
jgi:hypothetical protein